MLDVRATEGKAIGNKLGDERYAAIAEILQLAAADAADDAQTSGLLAILGDATARLPEAARHHKLTPAVYRALRNAPVLSSETVEQLREGYDQQILRHLAASADLAFVGQTLDAAGIGWLAMKGPVLADFVWPRPDLREYYDLDVLVDRRMFGAALQSLSNAGAVLIDRNWPLIEERRSAELTLALPAGSFLDLHWDIVNDLGIRNKFRLPVREMLGRRVMAKVGERDTPTFDAADTVLSLALHAGLSGAMRLVWLRDIGYAAAAADWDEVLRRVESSRLNSMFGAVAARVQRTLSLDLPQPRVGAWVRLTELADARWPAPRIPEQGHSNQALYRSSRRTTLESVAALARVLGHRGQDKPSVNPLHLDRPDPAARSRYLAVVESNPRP